MITGRERFRNPVLLAMEDQKFVSLLDNHAESSGGLDGTHFAEPGEDAHDSNVPRLFIFLKGRVSAVGRQQVRVNGRRCC
jgi:hypothetical protein